VKERSDRVAKTRRLKSRSNGRRELGRQSWIDAAKAALIEGGIENVKVDRLAKELGVTRGGFYWHFRNRDDLLDALLESWTKSNTKPFYDAVASYPEGGAEALYAFMTVWLEEREFQPAYDSAVRDWARTSNSVAAVVRRIDDRRIKLLEKLYGTIGFDQDDALIHARIAYYHQVGYYAMHIKQSRAKRRAFMPLYFKALTGLKAPHRP
jgi:AcrR family transcriptional regulator